MTPIPQEILNNIAQKHPEVAQQLAQNGQAVDVGGCGGGSCGVAVPGPTGLMEGGTPAMNQQGRNCAVVAHCVTFGVQIAVDEEGTIYERGTYDDGTNGLLPNLTDLGKSIYIDYSGVNGSSNNLSGASTGGYLQIYGINAQLLSGTEAILDALGNDSDLNRTSSTSISIYETTGCWCPFEACVINGQTPLVLAARAVPSHSDAPVSLSTGGSPPLYINQQPFTSGEKFLSSFTLNFLGVLVRSIGGGCIVAPVAQLPGAQQ